MYIVKQRLLTEEHAAEDASSGLTDAYVSMQQRTRPLDLRTHTSAYVSIRQHAAEDASSGLTDAYVSIHQHTSACSRGRVLWTCTSAYVSIRQHTSAYVSIPVQAHTSIRQHTYVSTHQHTYMLHLYKRIHQHTYMLHLYTRIASFSLNFYAALKRSKRESLQEQQVFYIALIEPALVHAHCLV
jgi:hypothetical protein